MLQREKEPSLCISRLSFFCVHREYNLCLVQNTGFRAQGKGLAFILMSRTNMAPYAFVRVSESQSFNQSVWESTKGQGLILVAEKGF